MLPSLRTHLEMVLAGRSLPGLAGAVWRLAAGHNLFAADVADKGDCALLAFLVSAGIDVSLAPALRQCATRRVAAKWMADPSYGSMVALSLLEPHGKLLESAEDYLLAARSSKFYLCAAELAEIADVYDFALSVITLDAAGDLSPPIMLTQSESSLRRQLWLLHVGGNHYMPLLRARDGRLGPQVDALPAGQAQRLLCQEARQPAAADASSTPAAATVALPRSQPRRPFSHPAAEKWWKPRRPAEPGGGFAYRPLHHCPASGPAQNNRKTRRRRQAEGRAAAQTAAANQRRAERQRRAADYAHVLLGLRLRKKEAKCGVPPRMPTASRPQCRALALAMLAARARAGRKPADAVHASAAKRALFRPAMFRCARRTLTLDEIRTLLFIGGVESNPGPGADVGAAPVVSVEQLLLENADLKRQLEELRNSSNCARIRAQSLCDLQSFYTSTQPLGIWMDSANFRYSIKAYQRGYEWKKSQVVGLLNSILKVHKRVIKEKKGELSNECVLKVSEVVLLQKPLGNEHSEERKNFGQRLNCNSWYSGKQRDVEVVDGQQRITTILLIYAVIQQQMHVHVAELVRLKERLRGDAPSKWSVVDKDYAEAVAAIQKLHNRFMVPGTGRQRSEKYPLVVRGGNDECRLSKTFHFAEYGHAGDDNASNDPRTSESVLEQLSIRDAQTSDIPDISELVAVLENVQPEPELSNAYHIAEWIVGNLDGTARIKERSTADAAALVEVISTRLRWLLAFMDTIDKRVHWTTTLTPYRSLALRTFVDYNSAESKVSLSTVDIIKVTLVSDIPSSSRNNVEEILQFFKKSLEGFQRLPFFEKLLNFRYINWLTTGKLEAAEDKGNAVMLDLLAHVRSIFKYFSYEDSGKRTGCQQEMPALGDESGLVLWFLSARSSKDWSPKDWVKKWIYGHSKALVILISQQWYTITAAPAKSLEINTRYSHLNLLALPDSEWRPLMLVIIKRINDGENVGTRDRFLQNASKQVEYLALRFIFDKSIRLRHAVYSDLIRMVMKEDNTLDELFGNADTLRDKAKSTLKKLSDIGIPIKDDTSILKEIYDSALYLRGSVGSIAIARAVLLILENDMNTGQNNSGKTAHGAVYAVLEDSVTVEHVLPRTASDPYWKDLWCEAAMQKACHMLGNLTLLPQDINAELQNKPFPDKCRIVEKKGGVPKLSHGVFKTADLQHDGKEWSPENFMTRHHELISRLASRYNIKLKENVLESWGKELAAKLQDTRSVERIMIADDGAAEVEVNASDGEDVLAAEAEGATAESESDAEDAAAAEEEDFVSSLDDEMGSDPQKQATDSNAGSGDEWAKDPTQGMPHANDLMDKKQLKKKEKAKARLESDQKKKKKARLLELIDEHARGYWSSEAISSTLIAPMEREFPIALTIKEVRNAIRNSKCKKKKQPHLLPEVGCSSLTVTMAAFNSGPSTLPAVLEAPGPLLVDPPAPQGGNKRPREDVDMEAVGEKSRKHHAGVEVPGTWRHQIRVLPATGDNNAKKEKAPKATKEGKVEKKKKKVKDPNAPKRPTTAYFYFQADVRDKIKGENPDAKLGELSKIIGEEWSKLSEAEKAKYAAKNAKDKERYEKEIKAYKAK